MPNNWNGWVIVKICNWFHARRGPEHKWIFRDEVPDPGNSRQSVITNWLEDMFPVVAERE